jgi:hypothetical protein
MEHWKRCNPWPMGDISNKTLYNSRKNDGSVIVHEGQDWGVWESLGAEFGRVRLYMSSLHT